MAAAGCFVLVEGSGEAPTFSSPSAHLQHQLNHGVSAGLAVRGPQCREASPPPLSPLVDPHEEGPGSPQEPAGALALACAGAGPVPLQPLLLAQPAPRLNTPLQTPRLRQPLLPLALAALGATPSLCQALVDAGAELNGADDLGRTALHWAAEADRLAAAKLLLALGATSQTRDGQGFTPLLYAASLGAADMAAALVKDGGADVNAQHPSSGATALVLAATSPRAEACARALLKLGADPTLPDSLGHTPLHAAAWTGGLRCARLLLSRGSSPSTHDAWGRTPLVMAVAKGHVEVAKLLVKKGSRWQEEDTGQRTLLHWAALSTQVPCAAFVLEGWRKCGHTTAINQPDKEGATPAHYAATLGDPAMLALLVDKGADLSLLDRDGRCPLTWACAAGHAPTVAWVCAQAAMQGAGPAQPHPTTTSADPAQPHPLTTSGAGLAEPSLQPLHAAACVGAEEACRLLLETGAAQVDGVGPGGCTALHLAARHAHSRCVACLLSAGASLHRTDHHHQTPLHLASVHGHAPTARELLAHGADGDGESGLMGDSSAHLAAGCGHSAVLALLLSEGCQVGGARPGDGRTPLHVAAGAGHLACCRLLLEAGADSSARDTSADRLTALDVAMLSGQDGCVALLLSWGSPSAGGRYHCAALAIQRAWWRHKTERRAALRRWWAAAVLGRSVRAWLTRSRAHRLRQVRQTARHRAATLIQFHWRRFIRQRRRYQSSYARLRAQLEREHLATSLILQQLGQTTASIALRPTASLPSAPMPATPSKPAYLIRAARSPPAALFPSGSLLFPPAPRRALIRPAPFSIQIRQAPHHKDGPLVVATPLHLPVLDPVPESSGMDVPLSRPQEPARIPLPPIRSLTTPPHGSLILLDSPAPTAPTALRWPGLPHRDKQGQGGVASPGVAERLPSLSPQPRPPPRPEEGERGGWLPAPPAAASPGPQKAGRQQRRGRGSGPRHSTFRATPLGYHPIPVRSPPAGRGGANRREKLLPAQQEEQEEEEGEEEEEEEGQRNVDQTAASGQELVRNVDRYQRLNEVLAMLQEAKETQLLLRDQGGGATEQRGGATGRLSDLKTHIQQALEEAIRLRADNESLEASLPRPPQASRPLEAT